MRELSRSGLRGGDGHSGGLTLESWYAARYLLLPSVHIVGLHSVHDNPFELGPVLERCVLLLRALTKGAEPTAALLHKRQLELWFGMQRLLFGFNPLPVVGSKPGDLTLTEGGSQPALPFVESWTEGEQRHREGVEAEDAFAALSFDMPADFKLSALPSAPLGSAWDAPAPPPERDGAAAGGEATGDGSGLGVITAPADSASSGHMSSGFFVGGSGAAAGGGGAAGSGGAGGGAVADSGASLSDLGLWAAPASSGGGGGEEEKASDGGDSDLAGLDLFAAPVGGTAAGAAGDGATAPAARPAATTGAAPFDLEGLLFGGAAGKPAGGGGGGGGSGSGIDLMSLDFSAPAVAAVCPSWVTAIAAQLLVREEVATIERFGEEVDISVVTRVQLKLTVDGSPPLLLAGLGAQQLPLALQISSAAMAAVQPAAVCKAVAATPGEFNLTLPLPAAGEEATVQPILQFKTSKLAVVPLKFSAACKVEGGDVLVAVNVIVNPALRQPLTAVSFAVRAWLPAGCSVADFSTQPPAKFNSRTGLLLWNCRQLKPGGRVRLMARFKLAAPASVTPPPRLPVKITFQQEGGSLTGSALKLTLPASSGSSPPLTQAVSFNVAASMSQGA
eukprot:PLAT881.1.p1 GENE.PLAT881.1~~PLAT881.1.p1  ORF type:complete len:657 (+),score=294.25 PLAT881.1:122-1972(+)